MGDETVQLANFIAEKCPKLVLAGLMTIGAIGNSQAAATAHTNPDFERLVEQRRLVAEAVGVADLQLSMGMSSDFEQAIRMGSDEVRVGTTIFGMQRRIQGLSLTSYRPPTEQGRSQGRCQWRLRTALQHYRDARANNTGYIRHHGSR